MEPITVPIERLSLDHSRLIFGTGTMSSVLTNIEFDDNLFDANANLDWMEEASDGSNSSNSKLYPSRRKVKDIKVRPFKCILCAKAFPQSAGLSRHRKVVHGICQKTLTDNLLRLILDERCNASENSSSGPNQMLHEALRSRLKALSKDELTEEFSFVSSYMVEIQLHLGRNEIV